MKLHVLRHGKAEQGSPDPERRLLEQGRADVVDVAARFAERGERLDFCYSSPYLRALQSAEAFLEGSGLSCPVETWDLLTPEHHARDLLPLLNRFGHESVLLAGHNPLLSALCALLLDESALPYPRRSLGTAELCSIRFDIAAPGAGTVEFELAPDSRR